MHIYWKLTADIQAHNILIFIACAQISLIIYAHADVYWKVRGLAFGLSQH